MSFAYLLKRLALIVYTLLVVSLVVFAITQVLPADAATMLLGENATPEALAAIRIKLGLDQPVWLQYVRWLGSILHGHRRILGVAAVTVCKERRGRPAQTADGRDQHHSGGGPAVIPAKFAHGGLDSAISGGVSEYRGDMRNARVVPIDAGR